MGVLYVAQKLAKVGVDKQQQSPLCRTLGALSAGRPDYRKVSCVSSLLWATHMCRPTNGGAGPLLTT